MKKVSEQIKRLFVYATADNLIDPRTYNKSVIITSLAFSLTILLLNFINIIKDYYSLNISAVVCIIALTSCAVLCAITKKTQVCVISCLIILALAAGYQSFFNLSMGRNRGFALVWLYVFPLVSTAIIDYKISFFNSLYYFAVICILSYVPHYFYVLGPYYPEVIIKRLPAVYLFVLVTVHVFAIRNRSLLYKKMFYQKELEEAISFERDRVLKMSLETIFSLNEAMHASDEYTSLHGERVSRYSCLIAKSLGWKQERIETLRIMALLHDIGKIGISENILNKKEVLTDDEYNALKEHTVIGAKILSNLSCIENLEYGALYHHEAYDGSGYPAGLKGEQIPVEGRIICLADAYDAMNSSRVYRDKCQRKYIREQILSQSGKQFDPLLVPVFIDLLDKNLL